MSATHFYWYRSLPKHELAQNMAINVLGLAIFQYIVHCIDLSPL